ncbi:hypothetical protein N7478_003912 [Penicillium angulare]|uniref:uncharacterized protein n=1 Tax=Penicillium angulare TaxID=116970 RepID=UPI0025400B08|nr:uncharacterized protein N7478_003912 [Penicillium angulare]KAJ5288226.1 hypothetical protein N7478_003912 [Penicillium angulare]
MSDRRCQAKGILCVPKASKVRRDKIQQHFSSSKMPPSSQTDGQEAQYSCGTLPLVATPSSSRSEMSVHPTVSHTWSNADLQDHSGPESQTHMSLNDFLPPGTDEIGPSFAIDRFPAFFEQVMLPGFEACNTLQETQQPRVFDLMQDNDITPFDNGVFGTDFMPELDNVFDATGSLVGFGENHPSPLDDQESASRRAAAFQR